MIRHRILAGLSLAASLVACDDTSTVTPNTLNLVRPVDIAFTCYGGLRVNGGTTSTAEAPGSLTAQPTTSCDYRSAEHFIQSNDGEDIGTAILRLETRPPGQEDVGKTSVVGTASYFGFILQSSSGTVAIANFASKPSSQFAGSSTDVFVIDADPLTPGKNSISVGEDPVGIATDKSGCFEVVANGGSCDVSTLDVNSVLGAIDGSHAVDPIITRLAVVKPNGDKIYAKPSAIVGEEADNVIGNACPARPSGIAYVSFPGCHMVAALDLSVDGDVAQIKSAITFDAAGVATIVSGEAGLNALSCPVECTGTGSTPTLPTAGTRPVALAYRFDPKATTTAGALDPKRRLAIGASNSPVLTIVDLVDAYPSDPSMLYVPQPQALPTAVAQVTLENTTGKTLGVSQLALSPQMSMGGLHDAATPDGAGAGTGGFGQYIYAVTSDHTVRVADVLKLTECDTQVDTRFLQPGLFGGSVTDLQCIPVASKSIRRASARGPGIQLPDDGTPNSVVFVQPTRQVTAADGTVEDPVTAPDALLGTFAIISSNAGPTYIVNVDDNNKDSDPKAGETFKLDNPFGTSPTLLMAHQLRHALAHPGEGAVSVTTDTSGVETGTTPLCLAVGIANRGGPRTTAEPAQSGTTGTAATGSVATTKVLELPTLRKDFCGGTTDAPTGVAVSETMLAAPTETRRRVYPDLGAMFPEQTWTMAWEGQLALDTGKAIDGATVKIAEWVTNSTESASLNDQTQSYCSLGVEVGDVVQMHGCNPSLNNLDCPQDYECYVHAETKFTLAGSLIGSCLKTGAIDQLAAACRDYLVSSRRFNVRYSSAGQLEIAPRLHELRTTPLDGCSSDEQCEALADYSVQNGLDTFTAANSDPHTWACRDDVTRKPFLNGSTKRCVQTCRLLAEKDADCDVGSICVGATSTTPGVCKEGVIPPAACVTAPQQLDVRAGEAFTLVSDQSGYLSPLIKDPNDANGKCILDPKYADPKVPQFQIARVPLDAPVCDPAADPVSGQRADGTFEPNPCATQVESWSNELTYAGGSCSSPTTALTKRVMVPAIKIRTPVMNLTLVDPYYPGDAQCPLDRGGASQFQAGDRIPLVIPGYQLGFHLSGGLSPMQLTNFSSLYNPVFPVRVVPGPTGSIWVLDDGDYLSSTLGLASTQGAVYRVESRSLGVVNELQ